ncbi:hypothetical protein DAETH_29000 [Deinococcus aetherius]|uniref:Uncharacterized protein n=1 Tax=Deinococcus aetherius TaxID=200252 RepID=A0ABM8AGS1_9DEIO|nr:hypothetical protein [Deinococcus aetherius]BDP42931.1 hypothetical protein DAETH_29000 [Deinococcus aetherius]
MSAGRYVLVGPPNNTTRLTLPADCIVTSGDGVALQLTLARAVEAEEWEEFGDGLPVPTPLVLEMTVEGVSEQDAANQATAIWAFARTCTALERDARVYRNIRRAAAVAVQHVPGPGADQRLTLTLLPRDSKWRNGADNTERLF